MLFSPWVYSGKEEGKQLSGGVLGVTRKQAPSTKSLSVVVSVFPLDHFLNHKHLNRACLPREPLRVSYKQAQELRSYCIQVAMVKSAGLP